MVRDLSRLGRYFKADKRLKRDTLNTFREYGGWWLLSGMAEWLDVEEDKLKLVWDKLEREGLMDRKGNKAREIEL